MGNVYFAVAHLTICYVGPLVIIVLCYAMICKRIWHRQIPGSNAIDLEPRHRRYHANCHHHHNCRRHRYYYGTEGQLNLQRAKIRALRMLAIVVAVFALSWLPLYATFARIKFTEDMSESEADFWRVMVPIAQWLSSANSCVNPLLYHFLDPKFRMGFRQLLCSSERPQRAVHYFGHSSALRIREIMQPTPPTQQRYDDEWV